MVGISQQQLPFSQTSGPPYQQPATSAAEQSAPPSALNQAPAQPPPASHATSQPPVETPEASSNIAMEGTATTAQEGPTPSSVQEGIPGVSQTVTSTVPPGSASGTAHEAVPTSLQGAMQGPPGIQGGTPGVMQGAVTGQGAGAPSGMQGGIPSSLQGGPPGGLHGRLGAIQVGYQGGDAPNVAAGTNPAQQQQAMPQSQQHIGYNPQMSTGQSAYNAPPIESVPAPTQAPSAPPSSSQAAMYPGPQHPSSSAPMQAGSRIVPQQAPHGPQPPSSKGFSVSDSSQAGYPTSQYPQAPYQMPGQSYSGENRK